MKNFTKVLALVLVVAMALSMVTMATAAFTDDAEITKDQAVSVLSTIGVLKGYEDGSFKPTGDVTRAEMAKMIATILNKGDDVGDIYKGACTFTDTASHWAAGYVAYCAQEKIINGKSAAKFDPDGKVTGVEAAKMLLCALGYTPDGAGLTGANWASNTLSLARKDFRNLLDNVDGNMSDNLNRENAAQMLLNALKAVMVESNGNATTISLGDLGSISTNVEFKDRTKETARGTEYVTLMSETFPDLKVSLLFDADGRPSTEWTYKGDSVGTFADELTVSYDKEVTGNTVYTDLGKLNLSKTELFGTYFVDGEVVDWIDGVKMDSTEDTKANNHDYFKRIASGSYDTIGANGAKTEIYYNDDNATLVVVVNNYYYGSVNNVVAAQKTGEEITRAAYVTVDTVNNAPGMVDNAALSVGTISAKNSFETEAFTAADATAKTVVAMTLGMNDAHNYVITSMVKADTVTGSVSDYDTDANSVVTALTAGGTAYNVANKGYVAAPELNSDATLYMAPNGAVLKADVVEGGNYAYVLSAGMTANGLKSEPKAELLLADGTIVTVDLAKIYVTTDADDKGTISDDGKLVKNATEIKNIAGAPVSYSVNADGKYNLKTCGTTTLFDTKTGYTGKVFSGEATFAGDHRNFKVNNTTKFVVGVWDAAAEESKYTVYTGLNAVPNVEVVTTQGTKAVAAAGAVADADGLAKVIFFKDVKVEAVASSNMLVFFKVTSPLNGSYSADSVKRTADYEDGYYTMKAIVDGEIKSVKVDATAYTTALNNGDGFYFAESCATDKNEVYSEIALYNIANYVETGRASAGGQTYQIINSITGATYGGYADGVLTVDDANGKSVKADDATVVYVFNAKDGTFVKSDLGSYNPYLGYNDGNSTHAETNVSYGFYTLDVASARVDTVKVAAVYLIVNA